MLDLISHLVIISPTGETMMIANNTQSLSPQIEESILKKWSLMLDIPYTNLIQSSSPQHLSSDRSQQQPKQHSSQQLPNLVAIKSTTAGDDSYYYPSCLLFISSSSKISPTAMAGVNGLFGFNQGFSEDLGDKWHRWTWSERISNYWEYACPREVTTTVVLDTLSLDNGQNNNVGLLQKAINEPVIASPLMATKSVATPGSANGNQRNEMSTPSSSNNNYDDDDQQQQQQQQQSIQQPQQQLHQRTKSRYQAGLSLVDFAMAHFSMPNSTDELVEYPILSNNTPNMNQLNLPNDNQNQHLLQSQIQQPQPQHQHQQQHQQQLQQHQSQLHDMNSNQNNIAAISNNTTSSSTYHSPQMPNLELDAYGIVESMDVDSMMLDIPNRWTDDGMDDLDNFDLGVTEEDFDFFESSGPVPAPATTVALPQPPTETSALLTNNNNNLLNETQQDDLMQDIKTENVHLGHDFNQDLMDLDRKQQQDILDTNVDQQQQHDISVTPLQVGMAQHDTFNNNVFEGLKQQDEYIPAPSQPLQHQDYHHQLFVPSQFAPIKIESVVNDAKYIQGGKFTYPAQGSQSLTKRKQSEDYRPDYIPVMRSSKKNKRKSSKLLLLDTIKKENKPLELLDDIITKDEQQINSKSTTTQSTQDQISSSEEEESSSSDASSTEDDDDDDTNDEDYDNQSVKDYNDEGEDISSQVTRTMKSLSLAQSKFVGQLTCINANMETTRKKIDFDQIMMDYDSPFARAITDSVIRVAGARTDVNEHEETKALDYLCQQAVMGGYPFSGGIEAMTSNGFEANEGESAKVVIARRRNLLQKYNGGKISMKSK